MGKHHQSTEHQWESVANDVAERVTSSGLMREFIAAEVKRIAPYCTELTLLEYEFARVASEAAYTGALETLAWDVPRRYMTGWTGCE